MNTLWLLQRTRQFWFSQQVRFSKIVILFFVSVMLWLIGTWLPQSLYQLPILSLLDSTFISQPPASTSGAVNLLYGDSDKSPTQTPVSEMSTSELVDTRLDLQLLGTVKNEKTGVAILASETDTLVVSEGEQVIDGVTLLVVAADYVILLYRGNRERLAMEDRVADLVTTNVIDELDDLSLSSSEQQRLQKINSEIRENPMRMASYVRFKGVRKNGVWVGIEVAPRKEHKIFEAMGLKPGDLIKSINGTQVQELADAPTLWNRYLQESRFDLQVERNGLLETISIDLTNITE